MLLRSLLTSHQDYSEVIQRCPTTMPGCLQAVEGSPTQSSHSTLQQISQTHRPYVSFTAAIPAPEKTPGVGKCKSPPAHGRSTRRYVPERRESCCTTQTKGVTRCPPALSCSPRGVAHHSKQNFPLLPSYIPLKPENCRTALEDVTLKPEQETLCAPHVPPLEHFG